MIIEIMIDGLAKKIALEAAETASHGDVMYLASPQHIDYYIEIHFNSQNDCHARYLQRGLLFNLPADAVLFSKSFISRGGDL